MVEAIALGIAINLASTLLVAGGRRLGEEALGDEQEQALENAFAGATAAMLVEIARHANLDRNLPGRLEEEFSAFFDDSQVAETQMAHVRPDAGGSRIHRDWQGQRVPLGVVLS